MSYWYQGYGFDEENGFVNVWTDGACSGNGCQNAKAGVGVFFGQNHPLNVSRPAYGRQTNNVAEIQAVTIAARQARKAGIKRLIFNTDSQYLIDSINKWLPKWKSNGWINCRGVTVVNKPDFLEMEEALSYLDDYFWNHVESHNGTYENEMADKLARQGINA